MFKRVLAGLALMAVTAGGVQAQVTFQITSGSLPASTGLQGSPYNNFGGISGAPAGSGWNNSSFLIWCIDHSNEIHSSTTYQAYVSEISSGALSHTRQGEAGLSRYQKAAFLASGIDGSSTSADWNRQWAIWAVMHGKTGNNLCLRSLWGFQNSPGIDVGNCNHAAVLGLVNNPIAGDFDSSKWFVITDVNAVGNLDQGAQEVMAQCPEESCDPSEELPTPEPATMTLLAMGLAGMAGTSLRRRRR